MTTQLEFTINHEWLSKKANGKTLFKAAFVRPEEDLQASSIA